MKKVLEVIVEKGVECKDVSYFGKHIEHLTQKFGVSEKTIYNRFKSVFGCSPRSYILGKIMPTKEQMDSFILNSASSGEVREKTGLSNRQFTGIYDRLYGVSTFQKAKLVVLNTHKQCFVPFREDNRSLIYSQLLGNGSYCPKRHVLRIQHGIKQAEYLRWKVDLLNCAYPKTLKEIKIREHKQGHQYADYYTPLGNVDIPTEEECVSLLTPRGWLLWWLDDGTYQQNISICCSRSEVIRGEVIKELGTYNILAREDGTNVIMCGQSQDLLFYQNFIEPFISEIPKCMMYKVEDIVGRVVI